MKNGYKKAADKNMDLNLEFLKKAIKNPEILKAIPDGAHVFFMPQNDRWLKEKNMKLAQKIVNKGNEAVFLPV